MDADESGGCVNGCLMLGIPDVPYVFRDFDRSDVLAGTNVTLEHAPPKSLGGAVICLTCKSCNNKASLVDQHAYLSMKAQK